MRLKAVIFDFDGTLTIQGSIDFQEIRKQIKCPEDITILDYLENLKGGKRKKAIEIVDYYEFIAAENSKEDPYAEAVIDFINQRNIPIIIISRNSKRSIIRALDNFNNIQEESFYEIISRDDLFPVKPDPASIIHIMNKLDINANEVCVVGDYIHDIQAGERAGITTIYKETDRIDVEFVHSDYRIQCLMDLIPLLTTYLPLKNGKYPNNLLNSLIAPLNKKDPRMIIGPAIGEDTAAIDINKEEILILKSDPITFTTENIGTYAVNVNLNDIATSGGKGKWMTVVLLLPQGIYPDDVKSIMNNVENLCLKKNLTICGGHTEITESVNRPVICCTIAGTVKKKDLINKKNIRPGDNLIMTKYAGLEGTSIIATDFYDDLINAGFKKELLAKCEKLINQISITKEADSAINSGIISGLHDVTEGGIATAISELSIAAGYGFQIDISSIPIMEETRNICSHFKLNPLGIIGSGSLIICCSKDSTHRVLTELHRIMINAVTIGKVLDISPGIFTSSKEINDNWPIFESDELTKLFSIIER